MMFSLFFLFSFSFAIDANVNYKVYQKYTSTTSNFYIGKYRADMIYQILTNYSSNTSNENYVTAFDSLIEEVENLGYKYVVYWDPDNSKYYLVVNNLNIPNVEFVRFRQRITLMKTDNTEDTVLGYYLGPNLGYDATNFVITSDSQVSSLAGFQGVSSYVLRSNVDIYDMTKISDYYCYWDGSSIYYEAPEIPDSIVMENPLSDSEIKSILDIFLESVRNADLPEHYGRYVLTYNKITGRYSGFVYPSYINLGINYCDFDENDNFYYVENSTGPYYLFTSYSEDTDYISQFLDGVDLGMKRPLLYEFRSNSTNSYFRYNTTYDLISGLENSFIISTLDEPVIYTSHKIYSLFLTGTDIFGFGQYEVDEETSIENQVFTDDETGLPTDTTINEYTEEVNSDVNLLSFIQLLFGFIFSLVSFVVRFFAFIVNFIIVPASTTILPPEFVTGIDWIHSFAFGEILLWDIFSILFSVLLSIYIVKLIRSH